MEKNKPNYFVRTLIIVLGILIISLIISRFYIFEPKGNISNKLIVLIALLIIIFLSEIFDSFSLGQFLSLKRTISEKNEKISELKDSNDKLLNLIINNNLSQKQSMTNVTGISPEEFAKSIISVIKADKESTDKEENRKEKIEEIIDEENKNESIPTTNRRRINLPKLEKFVLDRYIDNKDLRKYNFIENAQILIPQKDIDPVSIINPIFDGYIETDNHERFIEIKLRSTALILFRERLYVMLTKLYYYRIAKKTNTYLTLIIVDNPQISGNDRISDFETRLISDFEPAIKLGLLKIEYIQLNEKDMEGLYRD